MVRLLWHIADLVAFGRPLLLIAVWLPALLGMWSAQRGGGSGSLALLLTTTLLGASVFSINEIYDAPFDKGRKHLPYAEGFLSTREAWAFWAITSLGAIAMAFVAGSIVSFLLVLVGVICGLLYSHRRLAFKDKPWGGLILNGIGHGMLVFLIGFFWKISQIVPIDETATSLIWLRSLYEMLPYGFAYAGVYIMTTIPDIEQDRESGRRTLAVIYGAHKAALLGLGLILIAVGSGIAARQPVLALTGIPALIAYGYAIYRKKGFNLISKLTVLFMSLLIVFYFPIFFILLIIVIVGMRLYNRYRFGVAYP